MGCDGRLFRKHRNRCRPLGHILRSSGESPLADAAHGLARLGPARPWTWAMRRPLALMCDYFTNTGIDIDLLDASCVRGASLLLSAKRPARVGDAMDICNGTYVCCDGRRLFRKRRNRYRVVRRSGEPGRVRKPGIALGVGARPLFRASESALS